MRNTGVEEMISEITGSLSSVMQHVVSAASRGDLEDLCHYAEFWAVRAARAEHALLLKQDENRRLWAKMMDLQHRLDAARRIISAR
jgi:hypothetical protein